MLWYILRSKAALHPVPSDPAATTLPAPHHQNLDYHPEAKPVSPLRKQSIPHPAQQHNVLPPPKSMSVIDGAADITASIHALVEKYSLDQFTIATSDGLVFASSMADSAQKDAARFGGVTAGKTLPEMQGVALFSLAHKGSDLCGIIRTNLRIPEDVRRMIEQDTQEILNWWI